MSNKTPRTRPPSRTETQASFAERRVKCPACGNNWSVRGRVCSECRANRNALINVTDYDAFAVTSRIDRQLIGHQLAFVICWSAPTIGTPSFRFDSRNDGMCTMLRPAVTFLACLAISSASAAELTCKQWFEYGQRSHLPHGKSERMAEIRAAVTATFDTIEVMRADLAKRGGQAEPRPHNVAEIQDAVISACQREQDRQLRNVLAAVREATVGFELATYPSKP